MAARASSEELIAARLDDIARLVALLVRGDRPLQDVIAQFAQVGLAPSRIAELVGTSPGYVNVALTRAKKKTSPEGK